MPAAVEVSERPAVAIGSLLVELDSDDLANNLDGDGDGLAC
jgi:hypothetical protein